MTTNALKIIDQKDSRLVTIEGNEVSVVFEPNGLQPAIDMIKQVLKDFKPDLSTDESRKKIATMARKVASAKVAVDNLGKDYVSGLKEAAKIVDNERSRMVKIMDDLRDETRKPLTEWEEADEKRIQKHKSALESINSITPRPGATLITLQQNLSTLQDYKKCDFEEFSDLANDTINSMEKTLVETIAEMSRIEAERAELEQMRKEKAEREEKDRQEQAKRDEEKRLQDQKEREERIRQEAAADAERRANEKVENERKESQRKAHEAIDNARREKEESDRRAQKAEDDRIAAAKKANDDKIAAAQEAQQKQEAAVQAERDRQEKIRREEAIETAKREADKEHRKKINNEALEDMIRAGYDVDEDKPVVITKAVAKSILTAIALGKISHVKITY